LEEKLEDGMVEEAIGGVDDRVEIGKG